MKTVVIKKPFRNHVEGDICGLPDAIATALVKLKAATWYRKKKCQQAQSPDRTN
jgi:hypothetical protein